VTVVARDGYAPGSHPDCTDEERATLAARDYTASHAEYLAACAAAEIETQAQIGGA
jgi:hypothetical protein